MTWIELLNFDLLLGLGFVVVCILAGVIVWKGKP